MPYSIALPFTPCLLKLKTDKSGDFCANYIIPQSAYFMPCFIYTHNAQYLDHEQLRLIRHAAAAGHECLEHRKCSTLGSFWCPWVWVLETLLENLHLLLVLDKAGARLLIHKAGCYLSRAM